MSTDRTEAVRRADHAANTAEGRVVESLLGDRSRLYYEGRHGQVWDTEELRRDFEVLGFAAPYAVVRRRADGVRGSLTFVHAPRFYFEFRPES